MKTNKVIQTKNLKSRVKVAKETLKTFKVRQAKIKFFDLVFGKIYKKESIRLDNLWAGYTTDEKFTLRLEDFTKNICLN